MVDVFDDSSFHRSPAGDVIPHRQMLYLFAQPHASRVRANRNVELPGQQTDAKTLVDAAQTTGVDLTETDGIGLHELLKHDPVLAMLASCDPDPVRLECACNSGVAEDVVRACGLLNPIRFETRQLLHVVDRLVDLPYLIGIDH